MRHRRSFLIGIAATLASTAARAQAPFVIKARKCLTADAQFMVGAGGDYPTISALFYDLQANWDLSGHNVTAMLMDDQQHQSATLYGLLPGQVTPDGFTIRSSNLGRSSIVGGQFETPLALAYGAQAKIMFLELGTLNGNNDTIMLGQGARLVIGDQVRTIQQSPYNFMSAAENCTIDVLPGTTYVRGQGQCYLTIDMGCQAHWVNNGDPTLHTLVLEQGGAHGIPYWQDCFLNPRGGSVITHQAVNYVGTADGYRYVVDKGGTLDVGLSTYPNGLDRLPGSASTFENVQGFIF